MLPGNIPRLDVHDKILNPAEAEIWVTVRSLEPLSDVEIRGRLMGPRCPYATTVEVAYPLRSLPGPLTKPGEWTARVIIPEPSFWDPESPFLYQGSAEVRKGGRPWFEVEISHGLRVLQLGKRGLLCNGRSLTIRGVNRQQLSAEDALQLRREGYNTLLSPVAAETASLWDAADRFGFLVLGRLAGSHEPDAPARVPRWRVGLMSLHEAIGQAEALSDHVSCLGWLLPQEVLGYGAEAEAELSRLQVWSGQFLGVELDRYPPDGLFPGIHFIFAKEGFLALAGDLDRPVLLKAPQMAGSRRVQEQAQVPSRVLGWILE
jgi:hypothetical protein